MKSSGGVYVQIHAFLVLALVGGERSPSTFLPLFTPVTLDRRFSGPQSRFKRYGEVNVLNHIGIRIPTPW
jgi:hypothetical protein